MGSYIATAILPFDRHYKGKVRHSTNQAGFVKGLASFF